MPPGKARVYRWVGREGIPIPEFGFTAVLHHVVSQPGMRVTFEPR
jgi:hypothetical protein